EAKTKLNKLFFAVSGYAEPGRVLAIIGSSGAGKSTLLNMLTWRNKSNLHMTGEILANGVSMGPDISKISAYVQQDDLFMSDVTVKEHLMFAAQLRFDSKVPDALKSERVQEVLDLMTLGRCENTMIVSGGANKTLSGGEKKRLSLATELLTNPSIMFFDEPTSGLDSYLAKMVVDSMKTVAKQGCTVICTIHQPSSEVFEIFDDLMILSTGRVVYHGEAAAAMQHYTDNGFPCPTNYNPADHYIMKISMIPGDQWKCDLQKTNNPCTLNKTTAKMYFLCCFFKLQLVKILDGNSKYKVGFYTQLTACLRRGVRMTYRSTMCEIQSNHQLGNLIQAALLALVFLRQYGRQYVSSEVTDIVSVLFMMCTSMSLNFYFGGVTCFSNEMGIFRREHLNRMYAVAPYFIAKNIVELPTALIVPFLYATIVYFVTGMYPGWQQYIIMCIFAILLVNTAISFSYLISCATPSYVIALAVSPAFLIPMIVFGGFFSNTGNNTVFLDWIKYLSWIYYINELLNINQWEKV
uniref:ABC transporter domain-containing protein n=1 Tax=Ciona savignyi TaxID=51511 RepID=H2Z062_CIOSA